jgi:hypothetical protein
MGLFDEENRTTLNIILIVVGIIIIIYFLIPHIVNTKLLMSQMKDCQKDIRELRKIIMKRGTNAS